MKSLRVLSTVLAVALLLSCFAALAETTDEQAAYEEFMKPYDEPVKLTTARVFATWMTLDPGDDENNNFYTRAYKDHLNIEMTCKWTAPGWGSELQEKVNTSIASNDMPDVFKTYTALAMNVIDNGKAMEITPELYDMLSPYLKQIYANDPTALDAWTIDGKLMALPAVVSNYPSRNYWWVRTAWLDELGLEMPRTTTEVLDTARAFMANKDKLTGADEYMYGINLDKDLGTFTDMLPIWGVSRASWYLDDEGKMAFKLIDPRIKDAIQFFADLYIEGMIAPDFALKTDDAEITQDRINGKLGVWLSGTNFIATPKFTNWYAMDPEHNDCDFTVMTDFDGNMPMIVESSSYGDAWLISADCKNPEAVIKVLNLDADIVSPYNKPEWITDRTYDVSPEGGFNFWQRVGGITDNKMNNPYIVAEAYAAKDRDRLTNLDDLVTYDEMLAWETNGMDDPNWATYIYRNRLNVLDGPLVDQYNYSVAGEDYVYSPFWGSDTPAMSEFGNAWSTKFNELVTNAIIENNADAAFEEFVAYFYANGGDQAITEVNDWYEEHK